MRFNKFLLFSGLFLFWGGFSLFLVGCSTPCENLSSLMCKELKTTPTLCTLVQQESKRPEVSQRSCKALIATWPQVGRLQLRSLSLRYEKYRHAINIKKSGKKKWDTFDKLESKIRMSFRRLFRLEKK